MHLVELVRILHLHFLPKAFNVKGFFKLYWFALFLVLSVQVHRRVACTP